MDTCNYIIGNVGRFNVLLSVSGKNNQRSLAESSLTDMEDLGMTNKHIKRCSPSLVIKEMQSKTTMRCYLTLTTMAII